MGSGIGRGHGRKSGRWHDDWIAATLVVFAVQAGVPRSRVARIFRTSEDAIHGVVFRSRRPDYDKQRVRPGR